MSGTKYASKLTIGGETYVVKDKEAREAIANLQSADTTINGRIDQLAAANNVTTSDAVYQYAERLYNEANAEANKAAAEAKWNVDTTSTSLTTVYTDTVASASVTVTVNTTWDGVATKPSNESTLTSTGDWTKQSDGTYTKTATINSAGTATVAATLFKYTPSSGNYTEEITKNSVAKSIKFEDVAYYGFATTKDTTDIDTIVSGLTRITTNLGTSGSKPATVPVTLTNNTGSSAYLWILSKQTNASNNTKIAAEQFTANVLDSTAQNNVSFTSPENNEITLTGYKLYTSMNSTANGGSATFNVIITR